MKGITVVKDDNGILLIEKKKCYTSYTEHLIN